MKKILAIISIIVLCMAGNVYASNIITAPTKGNWEQVGDKWKFSVNGIYVQNELKYVDGHYYYFDYDGIMRTGLVEIDGNFFMFDDNGAAYGENSRVNICDNDCTIGKKGQILGLPSNFSVDYYENYETYYNQALEKLGQNKQETTASIGQTNISPLGVVEEVQKDNSYATPQEYNDYKVSASTMQKYLDIINNSHTHTDALSDVGNAMLNDLIGIILDIKRAITGQDNGNNNFSSNLDFEYYFNNVVIDNYKDVVNALASAIAIKYNQGQNRQDDNVDHLYKILSHAKNQYQKMINADEEEDD